MNPLIIGYFSQVAVFLKIRNNCPGASSCITLCGGYSSARGPGTNLLCDCMSQIFTLAVSSGGWGQRYFSVALLNTAPQIN